jgi:hypothetical protein
MLVPKILYAFLTSSRRTTCPVHLSLLEFTAVIISDEVLNLLSYVYAYVRLTRHTSKYINPI